MQPTLTILNALVWRALIALATMELAQICNASWVIKHALLLITLKHVQAILIWINARHLHFVIGSLLTQMETKQLEHVHPSDVVVTPITLHVPPYLFLSVLLPNNLVNGHQLQILIQPAQVFQLLELVVMAQQVIYHKLIAWAIGLPTATHFKLVSTALSLFQDNLIQSGMQHSLSWF